jgi:hypothetical protein
VGVTEHRIRLTPEDVLLICAALKSRAAMTTGMRRHRIERLYERLAFVERGNPKWRLEEYGQTHEDELEEDE